jgi:CxxC motif-containing protein (DUF1111 family)
MQKSYRAWLLVIAFLALAPIGLRALTWKAVKSPPLDTAMVDAGKVLFNHEFKPNDPLCNGGDGLGPVFNDSSCVACHNQGGVGGAGNRDHNVTLVTVRDGDKQREGVVHMRAIPGAQQETLAMMHSALPPTPTLKLEDIVIIPGINTHCRSFPMGVSISQRNTPALFGAKLIDEISERDIIAMERSQGLKWVQVSAESETAPVGRALRLPDGRVGRFGWKAQSASLSDFVQAACANELGLGNPGQAQPKPLGFTGRDYMIAKLDLTQDQCDQITSFVSSLPRPSERLPVDASGQEQCSEGKKLFHQVGCADCHTPDLGSVEGLYSDLLLHRMGADLTGGGSYNEPPLPPIPGKKHDDPPSPGEWRTPPLWGVADSAPYLHDGRAPTLEKAIELHGGQGGRSAQQFKQLTRVQQEEVLAFLKSLRAPAQ